MIMKILIMVARITAGKGKVTKQPLQVRKAEMYPTIRKHLFQRLQKRLRTETWLQDKTLSAQNKLRKQRCGN